MGVNLSMTREVLLGLHNGGPLQYPILPRNTDGGELIPAPDCTSPGMNL